MGHAATCPARLPAAHNSSSSPLATTSGPHFLSPLPHSSLPSYLQPALAVSSGQWSSEQLESGCVGWYRLRWNGIGSILRQACPQGGSAGDVQKSAATGGALASVCQSLGSPQDRLSVQRTPRPPTQRRKAPTASTVASHGKSHTR